jgi:hypothetical protein
MMRSAILVALVSAVRAQNQVPNIEQMLQGGTTAQAAPAPVQNVIPSLGGTPQAPPAYVTPAPAPPPAAPSTVDSTLGGSNTAGGLLTGLLQGAQAGNSGNSGSFGQNNRGWNYNGIGGSDDDSWQHPKVHVSEESREIVHGLVKAFMHKATLMQGEKECLENSVSQLTGDIVGTSKDVITGIKGLMNGGMGQTGFGQQQQTKAQGNVASAGIDGAIKLVQLVTLSTTLVKSCVQGDALEMMKEAAHNFINITRLEHRFMVSGVDIVSYLADSITAFENHRYEHFGEDIGGALRKILLSNSETGKALPEGIPEEDVIRKTTEGIMSGFFIPGEELEITDSADPNVDIEIDLHNCIAGNRPFFKEVFRSIWHAMAQFSANGEQHGLAPGTQQPGQGTPKWTGELMVAMLQLPTALQECGMGFDNEQMIGEALKTMGSLKFQFHMPHQKVSMRRIGDRMARGVTAWSQWHFHEYGHEIGFMLREFLLMMYPASGSQPRKYFVDENGRLRRKLESSITSRFGGKGLSALVIAGVTFAVLVGLMAVRTLRSMRGTSTQEKHNLNDIEMNDDEEAIE